MKEGRNFFKAISLPHLSHCRVTLSCEDEEKEKGEKRSAKMARKADDGEGMILAKIVASKKARKEAEERRQRQSGAFSIVAPPSFELAPH